MANCYLLSESSLPTFLPFLYPSDRPEAQKGAVKVLGAVTTERPRGQIAVGALAFVIVGQTAQIRSISVAPAYQQCLIATQMLYALQSTLPLLDCYRIEAGFSEELEKYPVLDRLFSGVGHTPEEGPRSCVHRLADFQDSPMMVRAGHLNHVELEPLSALPPIALRRFSTELQKQEILPAAMDWKLFDPQLSIFTFSPDQPNVIQACACLSR